MIVKKVCILKFFGREKSSSIVLSCGRCRLLRGSDLISLFLNLLLDDKLVLIESFLYLAIGHLPVLHLQLQLILQLVNLFNEYFAYTFLTFVNVVVTDGLHDEMLELRKLAYALCRYLRCHLFVVVS